MSRTKECKKINFTPVLIAFVVFFRAYLLSDIRHVGLGDFYPLTFDFSLQSMTLISLYAVFAVVLSLVISKLGRRYGDLVSYLSLLIVAEPLLFTKQENCVNLVIWIVGLLFVLAAISEKTSVLKEATLVIFMLVACVLDGNAIFLFVAPAIVLYAAGGNMKNAKNIMSVIIAVISAGAGIFLNRYLTENVQAFDELIKTYSYHQQIYFKDVYYENVLLFCFAIPVIVYGVIFFTKLYECSKEVAPGKSGKKQSESMVYNPANTIASVVASYIISVVGFIVAGSNAFYTVNYIIPAAVISLICSDNKFAEKALEKTNGFFSKYSLVVIAVAIFMCYMAVRIFFKDIDNLAGFLMNT